MHGALIKMFQNIKMHIHPSGIAAKRLEILKQQSIANKAELVSDLSKSGKQELLFLVEDSLTVNRIPKTQKGCFEIHFSIFFQICNF